MFTFQLVLHGASLILCPPVPKEKILQANQILEANQILGADQILGAPVERVKESTDSEIIIVETSR